MEKNILQAKTGTVIAKPAHDVFEAIVDPIQMSRYFITTGSGRLETGKTVDWTWADVNAELTVKVSKVVKDRSISFLWSASGVETRVELKLERIDDQTTKVEVVEIGWPPDPEGIARLAEQTQGWVHMLCCLKAYLEYSINLRTSNPRAARESH